MNGSYMRYSQTYLLLILIIIWLSPSSAKADLIEDFESTTLGTLSDQNGWTATSGVRAIRDANTDNLLMQVLGGDANAYKSLGTLVIDEGQTGTLFFRFQVDGNSIDNTVGLADVANPTSWGDYESTTRIYPDDADIKAQGRSYSWYLDMTENGGANGLSIDTWYHMWIVSNNDTDTVDFYMQGGNIATQILVAQSYGFRNGTTDALITFLAKSGSGASSSLFIDDIYVWSGQNLSSPIGPAASGVVDVDTGIDPGQRVRIGLDLPNLFTFIDERVAGTDSTMPADRMPERTYSGYWNQTSQWAWTSGFFAGQMWMMYQQTGDSAYLAGAKARTAALEGQEYNGGDHDIGFRVFNSFGQGYKSLPDGDPDKADYLARVLIAADTLAGRYKPVYQAIESWGGDQVIIDNMMNLELLFWAAEHTNDPAKAQYWTDIAVNHALTTQREHVRPDGSTYHVVRFDGTTGEVIEKRTAQGYDNESTWSRGQSWGMYGFTLTYRFTDQQTFLDTALALADYWIDNMPADGMVPYDFDDPNPEVPLDSSAMAIASSAMLELMGYVDSSEAARYFNAAELMLNNLASLDILTNGLEHEAILREGSIAYNVHHMGLTYGDYYFIEALQRYIEVINALPGDINMDGFVGLDDLDVVLANWNAEVPVGMVQYGDLSRDGFIGLDDLDIILANWNNNSAPPSSVVPEPASFALLTLTLLPMASRCRGKEA